MSKMTDLSVASISEGSKTIGNPGTFDAMVRTLEDAAEALGRAVESASRDGVGDEGDKLQELTTARRIASNAILTADRTSLRTIVGHVTRICELNDEVEALRSSSALDEARRAGLREAAVFVDQMREEGDDTDLRTVRDRIMRLAAK